MTDTEIREQNAKAEQDAITLDYSKWSDQRRRAELPTDHSLWQQERDKVLARQQSDNYKAGLKYQATLEAANAEKQREHDARIDRELEPQKQILMREWLANHSYQTEADFEEKAWQHLRQNLIEQRAQTIRQATIREGQATGRYNL
jgi:hypothetical protein